MGVRGWSVLVVVVMVGTVPVSLSQAMGAASNLPCITDHLSAASQPFISWCGESGMGRGAWRDQQPFIPASSESPLTLRDVFLTLFSRARPSLPLAEGELKRAAFRPWGGKRWSLTLPYSKPSQTLQELDNKRTAFSPWRGKRFTSGPQDMPDMEPPYFADQAYKRTAFSPWKGKRLSTVPDKTPDTGPSYFPNQPLQDGQTWDTDQMLPVPTQDPSADDAQIKYIYLDDDQPEKAFPLDDDAASSAEDHLRYRRDADMYSDYENSNDKLKDNETVNEANQSTKSKRANNDWDKWSRPKQATSWDDQEVKAAERRAFHAWAGKRTSGVGSENNSNEGALNTWKGRQKEFSGTDSIYQKGLQPQVSVYKQGKGEDKRQAFSAWAGKRDDSDEKRQAFSAWAGKRNDNGDKKQAFSAWAGKRDNNDEKRQAFSAWAGKRGNENMDEKRKAFSAWAGKRGDLGENRKAFSAWAGKRGDSEEKRQAFSAWAGKRDGPEEKRQAFSAWAGKRDGSEEKRQAFSAWAGKRDDSEEKRHGFSAWAGKRDDSEEKRQAFSAWAGKRDYPNVKRQAFSAWAGKRDNPDKKRQAFNAWAGKRDDTEEKRHGFSAWAGKREDSSNTRQAFSAWAGKRDGSEEKRHGFSVWAGKRNIEDSEIRETRIQKRSSFGAWKGKRSSDLGWHGAQVSRQISRIFHNLQQRPPGLPHRSATVNSWTGKRVPFSSWRGKRSYSTSVHRQTPATQGPTL